ncbi:acryloyl-CoA reductase [Paenibacillus sp. HB172176]|uniref:acrylyl-CoA reductase family protein n=1 Tax=Paenibacillus sp. HB172176 TaxID=2493690 RepID=UPI001438B0D6|nr:acryloyl-CoA reductase [Paenibacillus sp. HB172176]
MQEVFQALVVDNNKGFSNERRQLDFSQLPPGEVLIRVAYSSVNYKDALACMPDSSVVRSYPMIPGIDLAGHVVSSSDSRFREGQSVLATGYELGISHFGGYSEYARLKSDWILPLPEGLSLREAMILGTAGFTAAMSIDRLEENGVAPDKGKILVTGATGGVGGLAIAMLSRRGYQIVAGTGKLRAAPYLTELGAAELIHRDEIIRDSGKPLQKQLWQAAVDPVGGSTLAAIVSKLSYDGSVAVSGLTGGTAVTTSVMPFILRGVNILGIDSVYCPRDRRERLWRRLAGDLKPVNLERLVDREVDLGELPSALSDILKSKVQGRAIVKLI